MNNLTVLFDPDIQDASSAMMSLLKHDNRMVAIKIVS